MSSFDCASPKSQSSKKIVCHVCNHEKELKCERIDRRDDDNDIVNILKYITIIFSEIMIQI